MTGPVGKYLWLGWDMGSWIYILSFREMFGCPARLQTGTRYFKNHFHKNNFVWEIFISCHVYNAVLKRIYLNQSEKFQMISPKPVFVHKSMTLSVGTQTFLLGHFHYALTVPRGPACYFYHYLGKIYTFTLLSVFIKIVVPLVLNVNLWKTLTSQFSKSPGIWLIEINLTLRRSEVSLRSISSQLISIDLKIPLT